jgi:hypothetical protein
MPPKSDDAGQTVILVALPADATVNNKLPTILFENLVCQTQVTVKILPSL